MDNTTRAGSAPMATYPNSSSSLYLHRSRTTCEKVKAQTGGGSKSSSIGLGSALPLVEKEDVHGANAGHDPD